MTRAYYSSKISNFINESQDSILGALVPKHQHTLEEQQRNAWISQIQILKRELASFPDGHVYFEFSIPRMGKRVDNIVIINGIIFVIEFKVSSKNYDKKAQEQVIDYMLDLKNFHEGSHNKHLIPILVATKAPSTEKNACLCTNEDSVGSLIKKELESLNKRDFDISSWEKSSYKPTPTIVEAAQCLYAGHNVAEISRSDAEAINLSKTSQTVEEIIKLSKKNHQKSICFITGVPGSGKTLAGLNIATSTSLLEKDEHAVFLSGNGPLVQVLQEALARDKKERTGSSKQEAMRNIKSFIQNIHHFRDEGLKDAKAPTEKAVIFDEAQRAWNQKKAQDFMIRKKGKERFPYSEPEFLIKVMDRHEDWCVIICLIGEGQEINDGEAGLAEWFASLNKSFPTWHIYHSPRITQSLLFNIDKMPNPMHQNENLHLGVSLRSFRTEKLAEYVEAIINNNPTHAANIKKKLKDYPIFLTRDLSKAKDYIKAINSGSTRYGMVASSNAIRLRPEGIDVKRDINTPYWFLNDKEDIRSSYFMEITATEFDIQGLELDWVICGWDINLQRKGYGWDYYKFSGTSWKHINNEDDKKYLLNSYRVLLTRARQGMIIFVPNGDDGEITRPTEKYNHIYNYLQSCGVPELKQVPPYITPYYRERSQF